MMRHEWPGMSMRPKFEETVSLMRHRSYSTTQRYINMAGQLTRAVESLHVPDVLKKNAVG